MTVDHAIDMLKFAYLSLRLKYKRKQKKMLIVIGLKMLLIFKGILIIINQEITKITREIKVQKLTLNIFKHSADDDYESINTPDPFL